MGFSPNGEATIKLIDAHLHFFSWSFFEALARAARQHTGRGVLELLEQISRQTGLELPSRDPVEHLGRWLAELDHHGVDRAVIFASVPEEAESLRTACVDADDRLIPLVMLNPTQPGASKFVAKALNELGFRGILLFPSLHHFDLCGDACGSVLEEVQAARGTVQVHCGILEIKIRDLLGLPRCYDMRYSNPLSVIPMANRFPEISFVIPHFGSGLFRETLIAGAQCKNIYVDTSSSNSWIRTHPGGLTLEEVFRSALKVFGPERLLFGTDSTIFPRGWRDDVYRQQSATLENLKISIAERNLIFGENLVRIYKL